MSKHLAQLKAFLDEALKSISTSWRPCVSNAGHDAERSEDMS